MIDYNFIAVPVKMVEDKDITAIDIRVFLTILKNENKWKSLGKEGFYNTREWLIKETGICRNTFTKCIKHLKDLGYIKVGRKKKHYEINYDNLKEEKKQPVKATETAVEQPEIPQPIETIPEVVEVAEKAENDNINNKEKEDMRAQDFNRIKSSMSPEKQMAMELTMAVGPDYEMKLKPKELIAAEAPSFFRNRGIEGEYENEIREEARSYFREQERNQPVDFNNPVVDKDKPVEEAYIKMFLRDMYGNVYSKEKIERLLNDYFRNNGIATDVQVSTLKHIKTYLEKVA